MANSDKLIPFENRTIRPTETLVSPKQIQIFLLRSWKRIPLSLSVLLSR